jgi:hypothetical protein
VVFFAGRFGALGSGFFLGVGVGVRLGVRLGCFAKKEATSLGGVCTGFASGDFGGVGVLGLSDLRL